MKKEFKNEIVDAIAQDLKDYKHVYVTDVFGLDVEKTNALRRQCFRRNIKLRVVKNTLLKRAMEQLDIDYSELYPALKGSTSIMLTNDNNAPAKLIKEFRGRNKIPNIKGAFIEESTYIGEDLVEELVKLKSREELIGEIVGLLQSPIKNVVSGLQSSGGQKIAGIVKTLSEKE